MTNKEWLAGIGMGVILGGGIGTAVAFHAEDVAARNAIAAQACLDTYDNNGSVTEQSVQCMTDGWVPYNNSINVNKDVQGELSKNTPEGLAYAFVRIEQYEGTHVHVSDIFVGSVLGGLALAVVGGLIAASEEQATERRSPEPTNKAPRTDETVEPTGAGEEESVFDQDEDLPPAA